MIDAQTSLRDVAGAVSAALRRRGIEAVVVGGSAATIHAPEAYRSRDIDLVVDSLDDHKAINAALEEIGFRRRGSHYAHGENPLTVDILPPPPAVGDVIVTQFATVATPFGDVKLYRPLETVCDRLLAFLAWDDPESLDVALTVARANSNEIAARDVEAFILRESPPRLARDWVRRIRPVLSVLHGVSFAPPSAQQPSKFGFTTALHLMLHRTPDRSEAQKTALELQRMLNSHARQIDGVDSVDVKAAPDVSIEGRRVIVPVAVRTQEPGTLIERMRVAVALQKLAEAHATEVPTVESIIEQPAPAITTAGW